MLVLQLNSDDSAIYITQGPGEPPVGRIRFSGDSRREDPPGDRRRRARIRRVSREGDAEENGRAGFERATARLSAKDAAGPAAGQSRGAFPGAAAAVL